MREIDIGVEQCLRIITVHLFSNCSCTVLILAAHTAYRIPVFTFLASFTEMPLISGKFCTSNNIRNKAIFKTKMAKIPQNLPKIDILKQWLRLYNGNIFTNTTKRSGNSTMYNYRDMALTKRQFKKWCFCQKFKFL